MSEDEGDDRDGAQAPPPKSTRPSAKPPRRPSRREARATRDKREAPARRAGEIALAARRARRALALGAAALLGGVAMVGIGPSDGGAAFCVVGLLVTIYAIHTFGRLGPEKPA